MEISEGLQEIIISFLEGELNQDQANEFILWLKKDENNVAYFKQIEKIWIASHKIQSVSSDIEEELKINRKKISERGNRQIPKKEIRIAISTLIKIAASALLLISLSIAGLLYFSGNEKDLSPVVSMIETSAPRGSKSYIIMSDSTKIWLNSDTKIRYGTDYGFGNRKVYLEGEAYFKVTKNTELPFQVITNEIKVSALGTAFNVKAYNEEEAIETTLEEGQVAIDLVNPEIKKKTVATVLLHPKQIAVYKKQENLLSLNTDKSVRAITSTPVRAKVLDKLPIVINDEPDTKLYTSWKDPKWIIRNEKLSSLAPKLERRYNVKIDIIDKDVEDYTFTGSLLEESLEQILAAIHLVSPIRYEINAQQVKLYEDKYLQKQYKNIFKNY